MNSRVKTVLGINPLKFVRWNFLAKNVVRDKGKYLVTNWGSKVDISKTAKVTLHDYLLLNTPKYRCSREEAYLLLRDGAELTINGKVDLASRATIQVQKKAKLSIGKAHINHEASIIIGCDCSIGDGILISRAVRIFDSDFHRVLDEEGNQTTTDIDIIREETPTKDAITTSEEKRNNSLLIIIPIAIVIVILVLIALKKKQ